VQEETKRVSNLAAAGRFPHPVLETKRVTLSHSFCFVILFCYSGRGWTIGTPYLIYPVLGYSTIGYIM